MTLHTKNIDWNKVFKKEARGIRGNDLEVQAIIGDNVTTEKGIGEKTHFAIPLSLVSYFDGQKLVFDITEEDEIKYIQPP